MQPEDEIYKEQFEGYVAGVLDGSIVAGKFVRQACQRHVDDMARGAERGIVFDWEAVVRVCRFTKILRHSKGVFAGKPFAVQPWQVFLLGSIFGWKWKATGLRRFRVAYTEIARKNGKSFVASVVALYGLVADDEQGAEVYSLATKKDQARIVFDESVKMVSASPGLKKAIKRRQTGLYHENSKFCPLGKDSDSLDGLSVHIAIIDEMHALKNRELVEVIDTATGARSQPLLFCITTAGARRQGICFETRSYVEKILAGAGVTDDTHFAFIACLDDGDDPFDERNWPKANPGLGVSASIEQMRALARKAKEQPSFKPSFARYHCGIWCETVSRWIDAEAWKACAAPFTEADLRGRKCFGGMDLAGTRDLSSLVLIFPDDVGPGCRILCYTWAPAENAARRQREDKAPYLTWSEQGFLTLTDSAITDQAKIFNDIRALNEKFQITQIAYDRFNAAMLSNQISGIAIEPVELPMTFTGLALPTKETESLVLGKLLKHDGNPVLAWAMANVVTMSDPNGNIKPSKKRSIERIDPVVALICAVASWKFGTPKVDDVSDWDGKIFVVGGDR